MKPFYVLKPFVFSTLLRFYSRVTFRIEKRNEVRRPLHSGFNRGWKVSRNRRTLGTTELELLYRTSNAPLEAFVRQRIQLCWVKYTFQANSHHLAQINAARFSLFNVTTLTNNLKFEGPTYLILKQTFTT